MFFKQPMCKATDSQLFSIKGEIESEK